MRRLLAPLLAGALTAVAAPAAHAASGTLVVITKGPAEATVSLPRGLASGQDGPTIETGSAYALFSIVQRGKSYVAMSWLADQGWEWHGWNDPLSSGAATIRVLTDGPTTIRLPISGYRGTITIRPGRPLRGGSVTIRDIRPSVVDVVEDVIPFEVPVNNLLLHAVTRPGLPPASVESICTTARGNGCDIPRARLNDPFLQKEWAALHVNWWGVSSGGYETRKGDAYAFFSDLTLFAGPVKHYLIWMPTG